MVGDESHVSVLYCSDNIGAVLVCCSDNDGQPLLLCLESSVALVCPSRRQSSVLR